MEITEKQASFPGRYGAMEIAKFQDGEDPDPPIEAYIDDEDLDEEDEDFEDEDEPEDVA